MHFSPTSKLGYLSFKGISQIVPRTHTASKRYYLSLAVYLLFIGLISESLFGKDVIF